MQSNGRRKGFESAGASSAIHFELVPNRRPWSLSLCLALRRWWQLLALPLSIIEPIFLAILLLLLLLRFVGRRQSPLRFLFALGPDVEFRLRLCKRQRVLSISRMIDT